MGISCEITLCRPADGRYIFQPGSIVSGGIRYYLHEEYEFSSITVSLKGLGKLYFEDKAKKRRDRMYKYNNNETYVDIDHIIHQKDSGELLPVGQYETQFSFQLPFDIPASLDYTKHTASYYARCTIQYYVRIKFERPGKFNFNKHYKKEINVISGQVPRMTTQPLIYGDQKKLLQLGSLFSSKKGIVNLKATIANSVLRPGENVQIDYEIENDTNVEIKKVSVRLLEVDKYTSQGGLEVKVQSEVDGTKFQHESISSGDTVKFTAEINVPELCASIDHSNIIARDYCLMSTVVMPMPHINVILEMPIQVVDILSQSFQECSISSTAEYSPDDAPPTYWEAMGEEKKGMGEEESGLEYEEENEGKK